MAASKVLNNNVGLKDVGADKNLFKGTDFKAQAGKLATKVVGQSMMKQMLSPKPKKKEKA